MTSAIGGEAEYYQPPEPGFECTWCDGGGKVAVISFIDCRGYIKHISPDYGPEIDCPHCDGTGDEPELDEYDNPRIP